jgi:flagellar hook-associated protein 2
MGTTSSTTSSSSSSGSTFTGSSAYSADFKNVIDRAVAIASLPITILSNHQTDLTSQQTEMQTLDTKFSALQTAVQGVASAMSGSSFQTTVSAPTIVSATTSDGAAEGVYSILVSNIGSYATSLSSKSWNATAGASNPTTYTLQVGSQSYSLTTADNNASTVSAAINAQYGNLVQATTVNVGSTAAPDFRLSLKSATLGAQPLDLRQAPAGSTTANLQTQNSTGYSASQTTAMWDSSGSAQPYTLSLGSNNYTFTPADNSAASVAAAINSNYGSQVQATVVDLGTSTSHDYRISLQSLTAGATTLGLASNLSGNLQTQQTAATSRSTATWNAAADSTGNPNVYSLTLGATQLSFSAADNSAATVAAAINSNYGSQVQATVVNLGTSGTPDYRISLQDLSGAGQTMTLQKSGVSLQSQQVTGSLAQYQVDGSGTTVTSNTRDISVSTGVTLSLLATSSAPVDVTISRSTSALSTALSTFADAYNAAATELGKQRGQAGGPLEGQSIVFSLQQALSGMSTFAGPGGAVNGMSNLGLTLGTNGQITFNSFTLIGTDIANSAAVTAFLGSPTGGGFLQLATNTLTGLEDSTTGLLKTSETDLGTQITNLGDTITAKQAKVSALQIQLQNQMAASDAMISSLEQQYTYLSGLFSAQQTANLSFANG